MIITTRAVNFTLASRTSSDTYSHVHGHDDTYTCTCSCAMLSPLGHALNVAPSIPHALLPEVVDSDTRTLSWIWQSNLDLPHLFLKQITPSVAVFIWCPPNVVRNSSEGIHSFYHDSQHSSSHVLLHFMLISLPRATTYCLLIGPCHKYQKPRGHHLSCLRPCYCRTILLATTCFTG